MNSILQGGKMPETWKEANITLIPKEKQDLARRYKPTSLVNHCSTFTILAEGLEIIWQECIREDQFSFLPKRQRKGNIRSVLDNLEY